jgi:hypothetical protein
VLNDIGMMMRIGAIRNTATRIARMRTIAAP